jgi:hypothetical protein
MPVKTQPNPGKATQKKRFAPCVLSLEKPMQEPLVVRRETQISAPPAAVFALLTDPEQILR